MTKDTKQNSPSKAGDDGGSSNSHAVHKVIQTFGGIRPMAHKLGIAVSTVQGWKNRDAIPDARHDDILTAAKQHGVKLDPELLKASGDGEGSAATSADKTGTETTGTSEMATTGTATPGTATTETAARETAPGDTGATGAEASTGEAAETTAAPDGGGDDSDMPPPPRIIERPRPTGWIPGLLLGAAVLAAGAGSAVVLRDHWLPLVGGATGMTERVQDVERQVDALSGRVEAAPSRQAVADLNTRVQDLADRVAALDQRVSDLPVGEGAGPDAAAVRDLRAQQEEIASRIDAIAEQRTGLSNRQDDLASRLDRVAGRFDEVAGRLDTLGQRVDTLAETAVKVDQLSSVTARLDELSSRVESLASAADIEKTREASAEAAREAAARELGAAMAVVQIRDALRDSTPYATTLKATRKRLPDTEPVQAALATLAQHAAAGVPNREALRQRFDELAGRAVAVSAGGEGDGLLTGVLRRLGDVVQVRPVGGDQAGSGAGSVLARAEADLTANRLGRAIDRVQGLSGPPAQTMAPWLADAKARQAVEGAISTLRVRVIAPDAAADSKKG